MEVNNQHFSQVIRENKHYSNIWPLVVCYKRSGVCSVTFRHSRAELEVSWGRECIGTGPRVLTYGLVDVPVVHWLYHTLELVQLSQLTYAFLNQ